MKKRLLNVMAIVMALGMVFMAGNVWAANSDEASASLTFELDNPPHITVASDGDVIETAMDQDGFGNSKLVSTSWTVGCNNAFEIEFSDTTCLNTSGVSLGEPTFYKQDVDAQGATIASKYDNLDTKFAIEITNIDGDSGITSSTWGTKTEPEKSPTHLVLGHALENSPYDTIGPIMTADATGVATVGIYTKATATQQDQSGDYDMAVTLTVTVEEKGDS